MMNDDYRLEYDRLKGKYEERNMEEYREAKDEFFERIIGTDEYKNIK